MPTYSYKCTNESCSHIREDSSSMSKFKEYHPECSECKSPCDYIWVPSVPQVAFKDGPSGSWVSKGLRFKKYRAEQAAAAERRQNERFGAPKQAIPNYNGVETGTWSEAQKIAADKKGPESASTYNSLVKSEKS